MRHVFGICILAGITGCTVSVDSDPPPFNIRILAADGQCQVQAAALPCAEVPAHLKASQKLASDAYLNVVVDGDLKKTAELERLVGELKAAGFTLVIGTIEIPDRPN